MAGWLIGRFYIAIALALSLTLAIFAMAPVTWPLAIAHLFVSGALAWAYLRPMNKEIEAALLAKVREASK